MKIKKLKLLLLLASACTTSVLQAQPPTTSKWKLAWSDEFDSEAKLNKDWQFQNGPSSHILSSRWRENAEIGNGILRLVNKKENRAGQEWTSASLHTAKTYGYGYYECRYKYGNAPALNNSFWLMTNYDAKKDSVQFEIDINEGHYPAEVATNVHRHHPLPHLRNSRLVKLGNQIVDPQFNLVLESPIVTNKVRLRITDQRHISLAEISAYTYNEKRAYPKLADSASSPKNLARTASVKVNGTLRPEFAGSNATDGKLDTRWVSDDTSLPYTIELEWNKPQQIGCLQWLSGYPDSGTRKSTIQNYELDYWDGKNWSSIQQTNNRQIDLVNIYHVYGFEWNEKEMIWYFDGKEIRREANVFCHQESPILLSSAVIKWAGPVTDKIDGTSMDVDYVRYYKKK